MGACRYPHRQQGLHCPGHTTPAPLCPRAPHKHHRSSTGEVPCRSRESSTTGLATLLTSLCNSLWPSQWARPYEHPRPATGLGLIAGANGRPPRAASSHGVVWPGTIPIVPHGHCCSPAAIPGRAAAGTVHRGVDCLGCCAADDTPLWDSFFPRQKASRVKCCICSFIYLFGFCFSSSFLIASLAEADSPEAGEEAKGTLEAAQCRMPRSLPGGAGDGQSLVVTLVLASGRTR